MFIRSLQLLIGSITALASTAYGQHMWYGENPDISGFRELGPPGSFSSFRDNESTRYRAPDDPTEQIQIFSEMSVDYGLGNGFAGQGASLAQYYVGSFSSDMVQRPVSYVRLDSTFSLPENYTGSFAVIMQRSVNPWLNYGQSSFTVWEDNVETFRSDDSLVFETVLSDVVYFEGTASSPLSVTFRQQIGRDDQPMVYVPFTIPPAPIISSSYANSILLWGAGATYSDAIQGTPDIATGDLPDLGLIANDALSAFRVDSEFLSFSSDLGFRAFDLGTADGYLLTSFTSSQWLDDILDFSDNVSGSFDLYGNGVYIGRFDNNTNLSDDADLPVGRVSDLVIIPIVEPGSNQQDESLGIRFFDGGGMSFEVYHLHVIPEPATIVLLLVGIAVVGFIIRRHKSRQN